MDGYNQVTWNQGYYQNASVYPPSPYPQYPTYPSYPPPPSYNHPYPYPPYTYYPPPQIPPYQDAHPYSHHQLENDPPLSTPPQENSNSSSHLSTYEMLELLLKKMDERDEKLTRRLEQMEYDFKAKEEEKWSDEENGEREEGEVEEKERWNEEEDVKEEEGEIVEGPIEEKNEDATLMVESEEEEDDSIDEEEKEEEDHLLDRYFEEFCEAIQQEPLRPFIVIDDAHIEERVEVEEVEDEKELPKEISSIESEEQEDQEASNDTLERKMSISNPLTSSIDILIINDVSIDFIFPFECFDQRKELVQVLGSFKQKGMEWKDMVMSLKEEKVGKEEVSARFTTRGNLLPFEAQRLRYNGKEDRYPWPFR